MGPIGEAFVRIHADTTGMRGEVEKGTKSAILGAAKTAAGLVGAFGTFEFFKTAIEDASKEQTALTSLRRSIEATGKSWKLHGRDLGSVLSDMEEATGTELPELAQGLLRLVTATGSVSKGYRDLTIAQDVAIARHMGLAQAAVILARAEGGSDTALRRLGIILPKITTQVDAIKGAHDRAAASGATFTKAQQLVYKNSLSNAAALDKEATRTNIITELQRRFGGQTAAFAQTAAGQYARLHESIKNVLEDIGAELLPGLADAAGGVREWVHSLRESEGFSSALEGTVHGVGQAFHDVGAGIEFLLPLLKLAGGAVAEVARVMDPGGIVTAVAAYKAYGVAVTAATAIEARWVTVVGIARGAQAAETTATGQDTAANAAHADSIGVETAALAASVTAIETSTAALTAHTAALERDAAASRLTIGTGVATGIGAGLASTASRDVAAVGETAAITTSRLESMRLASARVGSSLFRLVPPQVLGALGVAGLAFGVYKVITQESDWERANKTLRDSIDNLGTAIGNLHQAEDRLTQLDLEVKTLRAARAASVLAVARDRAALATTQAAKGSLEYRSLENALQTDEAQLANATYELSKARKAVADQTDRVARGHQAIRDATNAEIGTVNRLAASQRNQVESQIAASALGFRAYSMTARQRQNAVASLRNESQFTEAYTASIHRFTDSLREDAAAEAKRHPQIAKNIELLARYVAVINRFPTRREVNLILNVRGLKDLQALRAELQPFEQGEKGDIGKGFALDVGQANATIAKNVAADLKAGADHVGDAADHAARTVTVHVAGYGHKVAQSVQDAARQVGEAQTSLADTIKQGEQQVASSIVSAKQNLNSLGQSLAEAIGKFIDAGKPKKKADRLTGGLAAEFEALKRDLALGEDTPELENRARALAAQLQAHSAKAKPDKKPDHEKEKTRVARELADITDLYNKHAISRETLERRLTAVLRREHITRANILKRLGVAAADEFSGLLTGIGQQASALRAGPQAAGTGLVPEIVKPLDALRDAQKNDAEAKQRVLEAQRHLAEEQLAEQKRIAAEAKKSAEHLAKIQAAQKGTAFTATLVQSKGGDFTFSVKPQKKAFGGPVMGPGGVDQVPAMLTRGEVVLNTSQQHGVRRALGMGPGTPHQLFDTIRGFAKGGVAEYVLPGRWAGLLERGNLDLNARPFVPNGRSISTVDSFSRSMGGREILVPRVLTRPDRLAGAGEAWANYIRTGENLGKFDGWRHADRYAEALHRQQARMLARVEKIPLGQVGHPDIDPAFDHRGFREYYLRDDAHTHVPLRRRLYDWGENFVGRGISRAVMNGNLDWWKDRWPAQLKFAHGGVTTGGTAWPGYVPPGGIGLGMQSASHPGGATPLPIDHVGPHRYLWRNLHDSLPIPMRRDLHDWMLEQAGQGVSPSVARTSAEWWKKRWPAQRKFAGGGVIGGLKAVGHFLTTPMRKELEHEHRLNRFYALQEAIADAGLRQQSARWAWDILHGKKFQAELHRGRIHEQFAGGGVAGFHHDRGESILKPRVNRDRALALRLIREYEAHPHAPELFGPQHPWRDLSKILTLTTGIDPGVVRQRLHGNFGLLGAGGKPLPPGSLVAGTAAAGPFRGIGAEAQQWLGGAGRLAEDLDIVSRAAAQGVSRRPGAIVRVAPDEGAVLTQRLKESFRASRGHLDPDQPGDVMERIAAIASALTSPRGEHYAMFDAKGMVAAAMNVEPGMRLKPGAAKSTYVHWLGSLASGGGTKLLGKAASLAEAMNEPLLLEATAGSRGFYERLGGKLRRGTDHFYTWRGENLAKLAGRGGHGGLAESVAKSAMRLSPEILDQYIARGLTRKQALAAVNSEMAEAARVGGIEAFRPTKDIISSEIARASRSRSDYLPPGVETAADLRKLYKQIDGMLREGLPISRHWYRDGSKAIKQWAGGNVERARRLAALTAIYSPQQAVVPNVGLGLRALHEFQRKGEITLGQGWQKKAAGLVMEGKDWRTAVSPEALKVKSFYGNLLEGISPKLARSLNYTGDEVTADGWMAAAFGYGSKKALKAGETLNTSNVSIGVEQYKFIERVTQDLARHYGVTPKEAQAGIWISAKASRDRFLSKQYAAGGDARQAVLRRAGQAIGEGFQKPGHTVRFAFEAASGQKAWQAGLSAKDFRRYTHAVGRAVLREVHGLGIPARLTDEGMGFYVNQAGVLETNPATALELAVGNRPSSARLTLGKNAKQFYDGLAGSIARGLSQEGVGWLRPLKGLSQQQTTAWRVSLGRAARSDELRRLGSNLSDERFYATQTNDGFMVVRKGADSQLRLTKRAEEAAASGDKGLAQELRDRQRRSYEQARDAVGHAVDAALGEGHFAKGVKAGKIQGLTARGAYVGAQDLPGRALGTAGRSDLWDGLSDRLSAAVAEIDMRYRPLAREQHAAGGVAGSQGWLRDVVSRAATPHKFAAGGVVPGPIGAGDVVPSLLSPGELVVSRPAISQLASGAVLAAKQRERQIQEARRQTQLLQRIEQNQRAGDPELRRLREDIRVEKGRGKDQRRAEELAGATS